MATLVTIESLKESLEKFRVKGDTHWALKWEIPTDEHITEVVVNSVSGLTEDDMSEVIAEMT